MQSLSKDRSREMHGTLDLGMGLKTHQAQPQTRADIGMQGAKEESSSGGVEESSGSGGDRAFKAIFSSDESENGGGNEGERKGCI